MSTPGRTWKDLGDGQETKLTGAFGFDKEANWPALSPSGQTALERYLCSKNKWEKAKPHASITFQDMRSCCPTQQEPESGPWMEAPLVWAGSISERSWGCFQNCAWPDGRGAGPGSGTTAQLGEEEGADGHQVSKWGGSFFFAPGDPSHECRPRKSSGKEAWLGSCQVVPFGGRQQPCHLSPGIFY